MSRQEIETALLELSQQTTFLQVPRKDSSSHGYSSHGYSSHNSLFHSDLPRLESPAESLPLPVLTESSILPMSGERVLPFRGPIHPLVEALLARPRMLMPYVQESSLPIVKVPPKETFADEQRVPNRSSLAATTKAPSPVTAPEKHQVFETPPAQLLETSNIHESQQTQARPLTLFRSVLFVYPPNIDTGTVIKCYKRAAQTVLHPQDKLSILWAAGDSSDEVAANNYHEISRVSAPLILQATEAVRQQSPFIHKLITETDISKKEFRVMLQPHAGLCWTLQQELQHRADQPAPYDLVIMPCLQPDKGSDPDLEKFLLEHSPVPVALVRFP